VAVISAARAMVNQARQQAREADNGIAQCALCCADCVLGCLERMVEYFNVYGKDTRTSTQKHLCAHIMHTRSTHLRTCTAYTQVAIYGKDFITAAKDTWALFKARGFDMLINDDLTGMVLLMGALLGGQTLFSPFLPSYLPNCHSFLHLLLPLHCTSPCPLVASLTPFFLQASFLRSWAVAWPGFSRRGVAQACGASSQA
jgi:hypothetical protein